MSEREPQLPEPISIERARRRRSSDPGSARWNIKAIAGYLGATRTPVQDAMFGQGTRLMLGPIDQPTASLELYSKTTAARIRLPSVLLELSSIAAPLLPEDPADPEANRLFVVGTSEGLTDVRLGLSPAGDVSLLLAPRKAPQAEPSPPLSQMTDDEQAAPAQPAETEAQPRVTIKGRVGAAPMFRTTPTGVVIARFPLAERQEESTTWHQVLVFGDRAEALREALSKGQEIEVVGYVHERDSRSRAGQNKTIREIYAAVIKTDRPHR